MSISLNKSAATRAIFTGPGAAPAFAARVPVSNTDMLILSLTMAMGTLDQRGELASPGDREDVEMLLDTLVMGRYTSTGKA